jgi:hypothetical protein
MRTEFVPPALESQLLPDDSRTFRLWKFSSRFDAHQLGRVPPTAAFSLTRQDAQEAADRGWPSAGLSIWNLAGTTVDAQTTASAQLAVTRAAGSEARTKEAQTAARVAYLAATSAVHGIQTRAATQAYFAVATPRTDGWVDGSAHASLFGLPCKYEPVRRESPELYELRDQLISQFASESQEPRTHDLPQP